MKHFDNYEIHGCRIHAEATNDGVQTFAEQCPDSEAEYWTLFGHIPGQGLETIRDFPTRDAAETMYFQITGIPFGSHDEVRARLRVMHAGPRLLGALNLMVRWAERHGLTTAELITGQRAEVPVIAIARKAISEATDGEPSKPEPDSHEALLLASAYIQYVKERNLDLHGEADGTPSVEHAVADAIRATKRFA